MSTALQIVQDAYAAMGLPLSVAGNEVQAFADAGASAVDVWKSYAPRVMDSLRYQAAYKAQQLLAQAGESMTAAPGSVTITAAGDVIRPAQQSQAPVLTIAPASPVYEAARAASYNPVRAPIVQTQPVNPLDYSAAPAPAGMMDNISAAFSDLTAFQKTALVALATFLILK